MSEPARTLLVNPTITSRRSARFPLALLHLAAALERSGAGGSDIIDGNLDRDFIATTLRALDRGRFDLVGITVMGGPQLAPAIALSRAIRAHHPGVPIAWGGYFPTLQADAAISADCVDYVIRGPGDESLPALVAALREGGAALARVAGLSWKADGQVVRNPDRGIPRPAGDRLPYELLGDPRQLGTDTNRRSTATDQ